MARDNLKLAAYLEEAGEEPEASCRTLANNKIHYVVLRHCWTGNVCGISDTGHQKLTTIVHDHDLTVICVASELGQTDAGQLARISDENIDRVMNICAYYKAPMVRVYVGNKSASNVGDAISDWMGRVSEKCIASSITPVLEVTPESHIYQPHQIAKLLATYKHWQLLYDPVQFILRQNQDPFIKYWTLLKDRTGAIDIRDLKIGKGFKPPGFGDSKIGMTIKDALDSAYKGWFFLEPSLGRRHGQALTKSDTFQYALEGLDIILQ